MNEYKTKRAKVIDANDVINCPESFSDLHMRRFVHWANQLRKRNKTVRSVTAAYLVPGASEKTDVYFGHYTYGLANVVKVDFVLVYFDGSKQFTLFTNTSGLWDKCLIIS